MIETYQQALPHGITLSCRAAGTPGRPVLIFLHGFPEGAFVWDALLEHFSKTENGGYRCVAPNMRGFEKSSSPTEVSAYRPKFLVQDIAALVAAETGGTQALACLVAHDWGGAVAWNFANQLPELTCKLAIINSPHPGTFLRELKNNTAQQAASAYMNFLVRDDAEASLTENDFARLFNFLTHEFAGNRATPWLTEAVKDQYRGVWSHGLRGGCNYYRSSPLRPPRPEDPAAAAVDLPQSMLTITLPTLVVWGMDDTALPPVLIEGLEEYVPDLTLHKIPDATHWIIHEQPALVTRLLQDFLGNV
ncbi:alpha/beta hydrolase [Rhodoferax sp. AJA081-3]|uniref:alpha/beta fold hydrolase n=1 Tax=Rhodoferax sp. AJA081-3 TaxID=2752316 RepID=UPI001ADF4BD8|nr:alpha/beta hydrolase [Rhodoferax sp. AJA081-3]QTN27658.1 alpha/beta hydrolase [Rhodoferax sp. AJA081-3]